MAQSVNPDQTTLLLGSIRFVQTCVFYYLEKKWYLKFCYCHNCVDLYQVLFCGMSRRYYLLIYKEDPADNIQYCLQPIVGVIVLCRITCSPISPDEKDG